MILLYNRGENTHSKSQGKGAGVTGPFTHVRLGAPSTRLLDAK